MSGELMSMQDLENMKDSLLYKLRLNKLNPTSKTLQKHAVIDTNGFLTIEGAQIFLDTLWQRNPEVQKAIATELNSLDKGKK